MNLDFKEYSVMLDVRFGTVAGSASYIANPPLSAPGKNLNVAVEDSGRRMQSPWT